MDLRVLMYYYQIALYLPHSEFFLPRLNSQFSHKTSPLVQFVLYCYLLLIQMDPVVLFECNFCHWRYYSVIKVSHYLHINYIQQHYIVNSQPYVWGCYNLHILCCLTSYKPIIYIIHLYQNCVQKNLLFLMCC